MGSESQLEKFIVDFVRQKTTHGVRLHLGDEITIRPLSLNLPPTGGAYLLAMFWANVLQHELNYPPSKFTYRRLRRAAPGALHEDSPARQLLRLSVDDDVRLLVDMATGELTVAGTGAYGWFVGRFRQMLDNVDAHFARRWVFAATPTGDLPLPGDQRTSLQRRETTETEACTTLEERGSERLEQRLQEQVDSIAADFTDECEVPWSSEEVENQLTDVLGNGGGLFDGSLYIYPLYLSVLRHWFSRADGATIYIASPLLDHIRLADIVNVCIRHVNVQLGALYTNFDDCDPDCPGASDAGSVQQRVLYGYDSATVRAAAEYRTLRHVTHPPRQGLAAGSGSFLARRRPTGDGVDVILTGGSFHARHLRRNKLSSVVFLRTTVDAFRRRYLAPLEAKAVTAAELY